MTAVAANLRKRDLPAEDGAVVILRYPRALALIEASWNQIGGEPGFAMVVYGDAGTLIVHQPRATREGQKVDAGRVQLVTARGSEMIEPTPLAADERDGVTHFLSRLRDGRPFDEICSFEVGRDVQEVLAAALRSSETGRQVDLPLTPTEPR